MTYKLTDEQRQSIKAKADAFWGDLRVRIEGDTIFWYVNDFFDPERYPERWGPFEDVQAVYGAIQECPEFKNRSAFSASGSMANSILETTARIRDEGFGNQIHHMSEYEIRAIRLKG